MSRKVAVFKKSKVNTLIKEARSVESQQAIISKLRKAKTSEYKKFFKALIDELYIGNDRNNLVNFVEDFDACVNVLISDDEDCMSYFKLDTVVRDHFMDAYNAISSEKVLESNSDFVGEPTLDDIIDQIKLGQIKVKWDGWFFSGGRDWGDWDCYALYKGGKEIGNLDLGDTEVHVKLNDLQIALDTYNASTVNLIEKVLLSAVKRDDKAFIKKITGSDGKLYWPRDWADISRTEVLSGIWKPDEDMLGESVIFESDSSNDKYIVYTHDTKEEFDTFEEALKCYKECSIEPKFLYQPDKKYFLGTVSATGYRIGHDHGYHRDVAKCWGLFQADNKNQIVKFLKDAHWRHQGNQDKSRATDARLYGKGSYGDLYSSVGDWGKFEYNLQFYYLNNYNIRYFSRVDDSSFGAIDVKTYRKGSELNPYDLS